MENSSKLSASRQLGVNGRAAVVRTIHSSNLLVQADIHVPAPNSLA